MNKTYLLFQQYTQQIFEIHLLKKHSFFIKSSREDFLKNLLCRIVFPSSGQQPFRYLFLSLLYLQIIKFHANDHQRDCHECDSCRKCDPRCLDKSCHNISQERDYRCHRRLWKLCADMVDMFTLGSRRSHDRCIRNRRTMIATYCACHTCRNRNDHQFMVCS